MFLKQFENEYYKTMFLPQIGSLSSPATVPAGMSVSSALVSPAPVRRQTVPVPSMAS